MLTPKFENLNDGVEPYGCAHFTDRKKGMRRFAQGNKVVTVRKGIQPKASDNTCWDYLCDKNLSLCLVLVVKTKQ